MENRHLFRDCDVIAIVTQPKHADNSRNSVIFNEWKVCLWEPLASSQVIVPLFNILFALNQTDAYKINHIEMF